MNVTDLILERAREAPGALAYLGVHGLTATYGELARSVDNVARRVQCLGVPAGTVAVVGTSDLYKNIVVVLALARLGITHAPTVLPARYADVAFLDDPSEGHAFARTVSLDELARPDTTGREAELPLAVHEGGAATFMLCPSSGTTGARKFVPLTHDIAMRRIATRLPAILALAAKCAPAPLRQTSLIAAGSSYGVSGLLVALSGGGTVLEPCLDAGELPSWLARSRVNYITASPVALHKVLEVLPDVRPPNAVVQVEVGGGPFSAHAYALAQSRLCSNVFVNYGSTECGRITGAPASAVVGKRGAVGHAYAGVAIDIVDEDDNPVDVGKEGIVRIRGDRNATSYFDDAGATSKVFRDGWVYPGDRGSLDHEGLLHLAGRTDDVINQGGVKINPQAVEEAMHKLAELREAAVFAVPDDTGQTHVWAAIVPSGTIDGEAFHARCRASLGAAAPVFIMHMRELPRNSNGKVVRHELVRIARESTRRAPA